MPEPEMKSWEEISHEEIFQKYGRGIEKKVFRLPSGNEADFYLSSGHDSIACLALTKGKQVILVKKFRPGPKKIRIELPGGGRESGESVEEAMARELLEETGYQGKVQYVTAFYPNAYTTYQKNALVVTECEKIAEPKREDNGETVEAVLMSLPEFRAHLRSGELTDVEIGYLGLDFLGELA